MGVKPDTVAETLAETGPWETPFDRIVVLVPWVTLAVGLVLEVLSAIGDPSRFPLTLGLAAIAAVWVFFMFARDASRRENQVWMRIYIAGLIVIGAAFSSSSSPGSSTPSSSSRPRSPSSLSL
jgi:hypothetical protein